MTQLNEEQTKQLATQDTELQQLKKKIANIGDKKMNDVKKDLESKLTSK